MTGPKFVVGDTVEATYRLPQGHTTWRRAEVLSVNMKYVGQHSKALSTPEGHEIIEGGRVLGPLYWLKVEGSRLRECPRWEFEVRAVGGGKDV